MYHNRLLHPLSGISRHCFFARFAWTVFGTNTLRLFHTTRGRVALRIRGMIQDRVEYSTMYLSCGNNVPSAFDVAKAPDEGKESAKGGSRSASNKRRRLGCPGSSEDEEESENTGDGMFWGGRAYEQDSKRDDGMWWDGGTNEEESDSDSDGMWWGGGSTHRGRKRQRSD
ncbi:hypothetical protein F4819DRAFT_441708, partial [Hypoxylon fuscum]